MRLLIDGTNVMGSRPDGWWRDRRGAARRLVAQLAAHSLQCDDQLVVVFDGPPDVELQTQSAGVVTLHWAQRSGRNAADDRLVELLQIDPNAEGVTVVTSDRGLAERARALGATVVGAGWILRRLDVADETPSSKPPDWQPAHRWD